MASDNGGGKKRRSYRPAVEALESLCLLSNAAQTLPGIIVPHDLLTPTSLLDAPVPSPLSDTARDTALDQTRLAEVLGQSSNGADSEAISSGIAQLNRYLSRAWYRRGSRPGCTTTARRRSTWRCSRTSAARNSTR